MKPINHKNYRKVWETHNGPIPKGYHIHHIDGDHSNNDISNLQLLSRDEHFEVHYRQGDWRAASILARGLRIDPAVRKRIKEGIANTPNKWTKPEPDADPCPHCGSLSAWKQPQMHWDQCPALRGGYSLINNKGSLAWRLLGDRITEDPDPDMTCPHCLKRDLNTEVLRSNHWDNCPALKGGWGIPQK